MRSGNAPSTPAPRSWLRRASPWSRAQVCVACPPSPSMLTTRRRSGAPTPLEGIRPPHVHSSAGQIVGVGIFRTIECTASVSFAPVVLSQPKSQARAGASHGGAWIHKQLTACCQAERPLAEVHPFRGAVIPRQPGRKFVCYTKCSTFWKLSVSRQLRRERRSQDEPLRVPESSRADALHRLRNQP